MSNNITSFKKDLYDIIDNKTNKFELNYSITSNEITLLLNAIKLNKSLTEINFKDVSNFGEDILFSKNCKRIIEFIYNNIFIQNKIQKVYIHNNINIDNLLNIIKLFNCKEFTININYDWYEPNNSKYIDRYLNSNEYDFIEFVVNCLKFNKNLKTLKINLNVEYINDVTKYFEVFMFVIQGLKSHAISLIIYSDNVFKNRTVFHHGIGHLINDVMTKEIYYNDFN